MDPNEREMYRKIRRTLLDEPFPLNCLSDNHVIRTLYSIQWDFDLTLEYIRNGEKLRNEYDCLLLNRNMFEKELSWNAFIFNDYYDKCGRPVFIIRFGKWFPEPNSEKKMVQFICFMMDQICVSMKTNVDQCVFVYDLEGCGYGNFSKSHATTIIPFL